MDGAIPDLEDIEIEISAATSASAERLAALEDVWRTRCPIYLAVVKSNDASVILTQAERGPESGVPVPSAVASPVKSEAGTRS